MKIKKIKFENFRLFENLEVNFPDSNFIVLIGNNGAGKTSILDGIATCLTHFTGEMMSKKEGYSIDHWFIDSDVTNGKEKGLVNCSFEINSDNLSISVTKDTNEAGLSFDKEPKGFINAFKATKENKRIPIISYQHINRSNGDVSKTSEKSNIIKIYDPVTQAYTRALSKSSIPMHDNYDWFLQQVRMENDYKVEQNSLAVTLPSLDIVRKALKIFTSELMLNISDFKVHKKKNLYPDFREEIEEHLAFNIDDKQILYNQLSSGQRMILSMVMSIARNLIVVNENSEDALNGEGIVLIDELELHLHPNWQLKIVNALKTTFPNVQFIATTHSPLVLSGMRRDDILVLDQGEIIPSEEIPDIYSSSSDQILEEIMFADNKIDKFYNEKKEIDILFNKMDFETAEHKLKELKEKIGASPKWLKDYERRISFAKA
ncbi:MAG: AAA family ATPase [Saprospiraceae bacterium]|jgi:predicted ATP-binding protein involved in virulence|nr:AAA family ATPase [Saprospiraceae bacterium]MBL0026311.1 AAA family ATPase [Saprospiraceae bacterium]